MDVDMVSMERQVKKVQPVLGGFDQNKYKTLRLWAVAEDQTKVNPPPLPLRLPPSFIRRIAFAVASAVGAATSPASEGEKYPIGSKLPTE